MSRIYRYDITYEQAGENEAVICSIEMRIFYTVTPAGGDDWNEPRYPAQAEFLKAEAETEVGKYEEVTPKSPDGYDTLYWWAEGFVDDHQDLLLEAADRRDELDMSYRGER